VGVFEFVVVLVLISTIGKVFTRRQERPKLADESPRREAILQLNDAVTELSTRVEKLEEERDFYRALLEPPERNAPRLPAEGVRPPPTQAPGSAGIPPEGP